MPGWEDSGENHVGLIGPGSTSQYTALYRGGTELNTADGSFVQADVDAGRAGHRLVTTTRRTAGYPYSTATTTA
ncbi:hypothetical protein [Streptomyces fuscigenes]|uniref:hypothetical protein n=1 Tax=Streptomyces fuscigenes TaxID=1528880 RepID=UPI001F4732C2|nr:hypothetical protein [Streptomyces fuscigenes]MCF3961188.1 hypothetical protein [Streptomyces fuscigenes]